MENVDQVSMGGSIEHNAGDLTQIGGSQTAINGGRIINRVEEALSIKGIFIDLLQTTVRS